jgi:hypothetical protein
VDWPSAFGAHCQCDQRTEPERECYLSAFVFGDDFRQHIESTETTRGFSGWTWAPWLWLDIDRDDLTEATHDTRRMACWLVERFVLSGDELLIFYSGRKGYHIGVPTGLWDAQPAVDFHLVCRAMAEALAAECRLAIDSGVYDRVRAFRAPNSRHPKTGLHKRVLMLEELLSLRVERIAELAATPEPFDVPARVASNAQATRDWQVAMDSVARRQAMAVQRRQLGTVPSALNRATLEFIREGAQAGDRHRMLFAAAANLASFGCSPELAWALLSESALDSGLPPGEVRRQIECGLRHVQEGKL